jgi:hypothetical protein
MGGGREKIPPLSHKGRKEHKGVFDTVATL